MTNPPPLLRAVGLGRRPGGSWAWRDVALDLAPGARATLVGPSGAGKTLLLRSLCGLDGVDAGQVELLGRPLASWDPPRARTVALWLPQKPLIVAGTAWDNLLLPWRFAAAPPVAPTRGRAAGLLEQLGRGPHLLDTDARSLSGGEEQLVALVRGLLLEPRVLLLDEPTAHLDPDATRAVEDLLVAWAAAPSASDDDRGPPGRALLWTTHDAGQVERVGDGPRLVLGGSGVPAAEAPA